MCELSLVRCVRGRDVQPAARADVREFIDQAHLRIEWHVRRWKLQLRAHRHRLQQTARHDVRQQHHPPHVRRDRHLHGRRVRAMQRADEEAIRSEAKLPAALVEEASELKGTMLRVVRYHLDHEPRAAKQIADIVSGMGYLDLASDLGRLAGLYSEFAGELRADAKIYDEQDAARARRIAAEIVTALGESPERPSADALIRSYAHLERIYEDIRAFGLAMFRKEGGEAMFPSLFSIRTNPRPRPMPEEPEVEVDAGVVTGLT